MSNKIFRRASWLTPSCFLTVAGRYLLETHKVSLKAPAQFLFKPLLVRQSVSKKGLRWPKMFVRNVHSAPAPHSLEVLQPPLKTQGLSLFPQVLGSGTRVLRQSDPNQERGERPEDQKADNSASLWQEGGPTAWGRKSANSKWKKKQRKRGRKALRPAQT